MLVHRLTARRWIYVLYPDFGLHSVSAAAELNESSVYSED